MVLLAFTICSWFLEELGTQSPAEYSSNLIWGSAGWRSAGWRSRICGFFILHYLSIGATWALRLKDSSSVKLEGQLNRCLEIRLWEGINYMSSLNSWLQSSFLTMSRPKILFMKRNASEPLIDFTVSHTTHVVVCFWNRLKLISQLQSFLVLLVTSSETGLLLSISSRLMESHPL